MVRWPASPGVRPAGRRHGRGDRVLFGDARGSEFRYRFLRVVALADRRDVDDLTVWSVTRLSCIVGHGGRLEGDRWPDRRLPRVLRRIVAHRSLGAIVGDVAAVLDHDQYHLSCTDRPASRRDAFDNAWMPFDCCGQTDSFEVRTHRDRRLGCARRLSIRQNATGKAAGAENLVRPGRGRFMHCNENLWGTRAPRAASPTSIGDDAVLCYFD